jgi:hypothetical protein
MEPERVIVPPRRIEVPAKVLLPCDQLSQINQKVLQDGLTEVEMLTIIKGWIGEHEDCAARQQLLADIIREYNRNGEGTSTK